MAVRGLLPLANDLIRRSLRRNGARSQEVQIGRCRVHYLEMEGRGEGPPILLIHGLGATACDWWRCFGAFRSVSRRVVAVDLPGCGLSPIPEGGPLPLTEYEEFFRLFHPRVMGEPSVIVGNSLGGALAARFAARGPEATAAAVLIAPAGARMAPARLDEMLAQFAPSRSAARELARRIYYRPPRLLPYLIANDVHDILSGPGVACIVREAVKIEPLTAEELGGITKPVLLIWGRGERVLPYQNFHYYRAHLPDHAEVHEVDDYGHCPHIERPADLSRRVVRFLERRVLGTAATPAEPATPVSR